MGAVLAGNKDFITAARRYKHIFGGALRQAGIIAAGCIYALDHQVERLKEDHENARLLAEGLGEFSEIEIDIAAVQTNMVFFKLKSAKLDEGEFLGELQKRGIRMGMVGSQIRAVTHLDISRQDIENVINSGRQILRNKR
jgi:threonine aldolase